MKNDESQEDVRGLFDAWMDDDLASEDARRFEEWLKSEPGALDHLERELSIGSRLRAFFAPGVRGQNAGRRRYRVALIAASLMAGLLGYLAGAFLGGGAADSEILGDLPGAASGVEATRAALRIGPGARVHVVDGRRDVVTLEEGTLGVEADEEGPVTVRLAAGSVEVRGSADFHRLAAEKGGGTFLNVKSGRARFVPSGGGEAVGLRRGEAVLLTRKAVISLSALERLGRGAGQTTTIATVPFAPEGEEDDDPQALLRRISELLEENRQLSLELGALRARAGDPKELSAMEIFKSLARAVTNQDPSCQECWRKAAGPMRAFVRMFWKRRDEAIGALREVLAGSGFSEGEKAVALRLLGKLRGDDQNDLLLSYVDDPSPVLRAAAVDAMAHKRSTHLRETLQKVFQREDEEPPIRVMAAGALVSLGDYGDPLNWLIETWRASSDDMDLRRRIVARVVYAPIARIGDFLIEVAGDPDVSCRRIRGVIDLLGRLGGPEAERVLEGFSSALADPDLRARALAALRRVRGEE